jgi:YD repeat-containing protein
MNMPYPTKILLYDLDAEIQQIINDLKAIQGSYATLKDRLTNINSDLFDSDTKAVVEDLITSLNDTGQHISERIEQLEQQIQEIESFGEEGNYNESFTYDPDGNVITHTVTGDRNFTVTYNYKPNGSGELTYSEKTYTKPNGDQVTIRKDYTYDANGNITNIQTTTTITPAP